MWLLRRNVRPGVVALLIVAGAGLVAYRGFKFEIGGRQADIKRPCWSRLIMVPEADLRAGRSAMEQAIAWSRRNDDYAIVVDKSAYTLFVFKAGDAVAVFPIELGRDPIHPKERQGDGCTPEGHYRITDRRDVGQTWFHRALLIDYPNATDRTLGRTGGAIEIHGCGTGVRPEGAWLDEEPDYVGQNWTAGCVGLRSAHMDSLFALTDGETQIGPGTPVTIIYAGSQPDDRYATIEGSVARGPASVRVPCSDRRG